MLILAVKALLAPMFVVGASVAARRFGPWVGGIVGGLPVVAGPILLAYALEHGRAFAGHAAAGTLLGLLSLTAFVVVYGRLAARAPWFTCMLCGWVAFALVTVALDGLVVPAGVALGLVCTGFAAGLLLLPGQPHVPAIAAADGEVGANAEVGAAGEVGAGAVVGAAGGRGAAPAWDLPVRAACALALVLALTTAAGWLGPQLSGLLAPFPVITTVLATFTHSQRGADEAIRLLRGMLTGFLAFALFCFTLAVTLAGATVASAFILATSAALATQAVMLARLRRRTAIPAEVQLLR